MSGVIKTVRTTSAGDEQITGFYLPGEYVGLDELPGPRYQSYARAIDDCVVQRMSLQRLSTLMEADEPRRQVYQLMSRHLQQQKARFPLLTGMSAGRRLADFIYDIAIRTSPAGLLSRQFRLPMRRCDMADYLGMAPETVTREIIKLVNAGAFQFSKKTVSALRPDVMKRLAGTEAENRSRRE
jgi:CRP/FNR family transcriptional regulator